MEEGYGEASAGSPSTRTTRVRWTRAVAVVAVIGVGGCAADQDDASESPETAPGPSASAVAPSVDVAVDLGVRNARMPLDGVVTAGQPTPAQLDALGAAGFEHFISLRPTSEEGAGWEEAYVAERSYDFERLAISGADDLTRENVEAFASLLDAGGDRPTVLYCASSNRVGAMLALKAFWVDGVGADEALQLGRDAGLTGLESRVAELMEKGD